jgi:hypothetical protein
MEQSEVKLWPLRHRPQGPLAPHIDAFAVCLSEQGFKRHSITPQILLISKLSRWIKSQAVGLDLLADEQVDRFQRLMESCKSARAGDRFCLSRLMTLLRQAGIVGQQAPTPAVDATPIQIVIVAYGQHLRKAQALSPATLIQYMPFAERFLAERFGSGAVELSELRAADVVGFITRQAARLGQARAKCSTIAFGMCQGLEGAQAGPGIGVKVGQPNLLPGIGLASSSRNQRRQRFLACTQEQQPPAQRGACRPVSVRTRLALAIGQQIGQMPRP